MKENEISVNDISREKKSNEENEKNEVKSSFFHKAIPFMPKYLAIICCILNILIPGFGNIFNNLKKMDSN